MYYFLRHPRTTWNEEGRMQGSKEGKILKDAKEEARGCVERLSLDNVTHIYHAGNKRTRYLANLLRKKYSGAQLVEDSRLNERNFGEYEGFYRQEVPWVFEATDYENRYKWKPPEGESHKEVGRRIKSFLDFLKKTHRSSQVICVTSGGVLRNLVRAVRKVSLEKMYALDIPNLGLVKFN